MRMKANPGPRVPALLRLPEELHQRLVAAADRNLRSMNNEAAIRLQQSFERDGNATEEKTAA
jgi:Arc-like DNA binding domain